MAERVAEGGRGALPKFDERGLLPAGIHHAGWEEFVARFVYNPPRRKLFKGLLRALPMLREAGCRTVYVAGSFTSDKEVPNDFDLVWDSVDVRWRELRLARPVFFEMTPGSPWQKSLFGGEFFPSEGIETESGLNYLEFMKRDRRKRPRGVVALDITQMRNPKGIRK